MRPSLRAKTVPTADLDSTSRDAMWALFREHYEDVAREVFERDLKDKRHVILLRCTENDSIQGFSTITTFEEEVEGEKVVGIFSGDTIIAPRYWRQTALQRAFLSYVIKVRLKSPHRPVYWFLISKGYRTYLLMAKNFPEHWPRYDRPTPPRQAAIIDAFAKRRFPSAWRPELGILRFNEPAGRLREAVAPIDDEARESPEVRFFEEKNPNHERGEELCCIGKVGAGLWLYYTSKLAKRLLREGFWGRR